MNIRKKLATIFLTMGLLLTGISTAIAKDYTDVPDDYWAAEEIEDVVTKKIVPLYGDNTYRPFNTGNLF